ncbi:MAG: glutamine synthetase type III, partial [Methylococcaceae bacterium]|nr:glutamine synthetase type III [Methylococcaceae bacterium]
QISKGEITGSLNAGVMDLGINTLPVFNKDSGDRNRTSPFAFTGNRFEFRAVGSGQSVAGPLVAMNSMLADSLNWIADSLEAELKAGLSLDAAILKTLKEVIDNHGAVVFGGNGYSAEWHKMAVEERGLANLKTAADALPVLKEAYIEELFSKLGVLSPVELASRFEIYAEQYILAIEVEAKLVVSMAKTGIFPAVVAYLSELSGTINSLKNNGITLSSDAAGQIAALLDTMMALVAKLSAALKQHDFDSPEAHMQFCAQTLRPLMDEIRGYADTLEGEIADAQWPFPTYQEMLFIK